MRGDASRASSPEEKGQLNGAENQICPHLNRPSLAYRVQEVLMLNDWSSRARIYKMSDRPEVSERHEAALSVLELMRASHTADLAARAAPKKVAVGADFAWARDSTVSTWAFRTPGQMCHVPTPAAPPPARRLALGLFSAPPPANANAASAGAVTSEVRPEAHAIATAEILPDGTLVVNQLAVHPSETHREGSTTALRMLCGLRALASAVQVRIWLGERGQREGLGK
jgi:hypothetical protein